ncbi:MAG: TOBE domain-containing protein [Rhodospirillales bacterium]|nr:TOBE domain-containing protein [Rhodospirillales bacterium]
MTTTALRQHQPPVLRGLFITALPPVVPAERASRPCSAEPANTACRITDPPVRNATFPHRTCCYYPLHLLRRIYPPATEAAAISLKHLQPIVAFRSEDGIEISDQRIRLLEAIDSLGSISAAARTAGLTYRGAWDAVAAINQIAEQPLVLGRTGGRAGGGASLTDDGRRFLRAVQPIRRELHRYMHTVELDLGSDLVVPSFSWKHLMRTSARNTLLCTIADIKHGAVNAEILLDVAPGIQLVAIITEESVRNLELATGRDVFALIKSSFVLLAPAGEVGRTSARNMLTGTVARREDGAVNSEIILDIGSGKSIAAIITKESASSLGFKVGDRVSALIKASHIILAID